jgi:molybdopterin molybdotransferase
LLVVKKFGIKALLLQKKRMITFEEAYKIVIQSSITTDVANVSLEDAVGRVLAGNIFSDTAMPPFDKSAVDGYACRRSDLGEALEVIEEIPAGRKPMKVIEKGCCAKIMTGAMVPEGADTVIMVEFTEQVANDKIRFTGTTTSANICYAGEDVKLGQLVLTKGTFLRPQDIAILASVGEASPQVYLKPIVGVISTGDELVEPHVKPGLSLIRNSNASQTIAQIKNAGATPIYFGIAKDTEDSTRELLTKAFNNSDITLLTGGVSMGDYDYVPKVMQDLNIHILFKSLAVQPGRPTVFGTKPGKFIFGLPGNPVSSFVQFEMLVKPLIYKMMGNIFEPPVIKLPMGETFWRRKTSRKTLLPVKIKEGQVFPVDYHGSAHIHAYSFADGILAMEIGKSEIIKGELVDVRQI